MIYLKNNTEIQTIYIPRQTVLGGGYIATTKTYEDGLAEGIERGKEIQKGQLLNLYVTENGEYEREDGWGAITVNIPREECPEGGSCNLGIGEFGFDSNTVGDYELYASDDGYDGWSKMFIHIYGDGGAIRVRRASDLLDSFNNDNGAGLDYGWNYYVGGIITEKQEFNTEYDYATYILDNGFKIYRGKWLNGDSFLGEDPIKLGAYAIVYGVLQDNNGELGLEEGSQMVAYQECGGGSCNLEDKSVIPSMSDRDNNGLIVVNPSEGYNGLKRTVINPQTLYNEGVEAGRTEGEASLAAKARVLEVTENGTYLSKFSDPIAPTNYTVTGLYADGTEFHSYAELSSKVFNTNIPANKDSRIEFWWKNDATYNRYATIIGGQTDEGGYIFKFAEYSRNTYRIEYGNHRYGKLFEHNFTYDMTSRWNHIIFSKQDGLYVNDELICNVQGEAWAENETIPNFLINAAYLGEIDNNANGAFGMIKINDTIIIPTADGFQNVNTGELLEVMRTGTYNFTENIPIYGEGELYKTINVNVPDLNGSYDEGKTDGINEQKSKLETINITENGTYTKEDGYNKIIVKVPDLNGSYDEGYAQGQADIASNAKVLNVTENGVYKTKFSDPIMPTLVTGVYADGTKFYNYAELKGKVFNTNILATTNSRIEFWYKGDNKVSGDAYNTIIGAGNDNSKSEKFQILYNSTSNNQLLVEIGNSLNRVIAWDDDRVWHHLILSKAEGLLIDGEKKADFSPTNTVDGDFFINGVAHVIKEGNNRIANGCFGMIKIDDVIIIPTADGFKNVNTGELLEVVKDGDYIFTKNLPTYGEGEIYKTINVNVPTAQEQAFNYDITAFTYKVYDWTSVNINRDNMTNDCNNRPLDCLLLRNRNGECTVMTKLDTCSGTARLENGWSGDSIILSLKSNSIAKFSSNSINSNRLTSIDTGFAQLEGNAITNCNALTDIKVTVVNNDLSNKYATNCFNGLPAEGTITIRKSGSAVTLTDDEITSFFRTIVGEGWTITIE